jgi:hypothetical protein
MSKPWMLQVSAPVSQLCKLGPVLQYCARETAQHNKRKNLPRLSSQEVPFQPFSREFVIQSLCLILTNSVFHVSSANQPLMKAQFANAAREPIGGLMRKLQAANPTISAIQNERNGNTTTSGGRPLTPLAEQDEDDPAMTAAARAKAEKERTRELESQKARIVAQMVPGEEPAYEEDEDEDPPVPGNFNVDRRQRDALTEHKRVSSQAFDNLKLNEKRPERETVDLDTVYDRENVPPQARQRREDRDDRRRSNDLPASTASKLSTQYSASSSVATRNPPAPSTTSQLPTKYQPPSPTRGSSAMPSIPPTTTTSSVASSSRSHGFDVFGKTLSDAFAAMDADRDFPDKRKLCSPSSSLYI